MQLFPCIYIKISLEEHERHWLLWFFLGQRTGRRYFYFIPFYNIVFKNINILPIQKTKFINKNTHKWFFTMWKTSKCKCYPRPLSSKCRASLVISVAHNEWLTFFWLSLFSHLDQMPPTRRAPGGHTRALCPAHSSSLHLLLLGLLDSIFPWAETLNLWSK